MPIFSDDATLAPHERLQKMAAILALAVRRRLVVSRRLDTPVGDRELPVAVDTPPKQRRRDFTIRLR